MRCDVMRTRILVFSATHTQAPGPPCWCSKQPCLENCLEDWFVLTGRTLWPREAARLVDHCLTRLV
ncbi:hypothetical protein E2C01_052954 [Portunus trituberculatus]|uniref:Uncharacterized protein n=1 Tax=Portunus trituberculatus TaxID=210409 RepID=A0A5B7GFW1_PORTR|nr:hypothetical protein [Portunus trituberculatus]